MKKIILLLFICPILAYSNNKKPVNTTITAATVYLEGATITRTGQLQLVKGENVFVFENLSPDIEENSVQLSGLGDASVRSIVTSINFLEQKETSKEFKALGQKIKAIEMQINSINNTIAGYNEEVKILGKNQVIHGQQSNISIERVKEITTYYRNRITQINNDLYQQRMALDSLVQFKNKSANQQTLLDDNKKDPRGQITVVIDAASPEFINLELRYNVATAGWYPSYDVRAKSVTDPIAITYKANVYQQTGSDWNNIDIILSTGDPSTNNSKPKLGPKYLNFASTLNYNSSPTASSAYKYNPTIKKVTGIVVDDTGLPLPGVNIIERGTSNGTQTDFDGAYNLFIEGGRYLDFSYVGFETVTLPIFSSNIGVSMLPGSELEEVVIIAQGIKRESKALGYAVSELDVARVLSGKASGVSITGQAGTNGSAANVAIRGYNSITGNSQPLYIVDGVPISADTLNQDFLNGNSGTSSFLDQDNVASVEVLEGLAAQTLYGTAAYNGVVVITTKNGEGLNSLGNTKFAGLTTTRFEIREKYSITSNSKMTSIDLDKFSLAAEYEYYAAPALNENVFLTATIKNWEAYDLLNGEANIYFDGSYAGKTIINPRATTKGLVLSLGPDSGIAIQRKEKENFKSKSFLGSNRVIDRQFEILVKNNKPLAIKLRVEDRIPISQDKEIKVEDLLFGGAQYNDQTGLLVWEINLEPQGQSTYNFGFTVKYPKNKNINL